MTQSQPDDPNCNPRAKATAERVARLKRTRDLAGTLARRLESLGVPVNNADFPDEVMIGPDAKSLQAMMDLLDRLMDAAEQD